MLESTSEVAPPLPQGHSTARLRRAVVKQFPEDDARIGRREERWLDAMGPEICPQLLGRVDGGYIMEELLSIRDEDHRDLPEEVLNLLFNRIWSEDYIERVVSDYPGETWVQRVSDIFSIEVPDEVVQAASRSSICCHGDPTFSNVMRHPVDRRLRLIDPCHRDYTPQTWGVDAGKVLQSMLGWEFLQAGWEPCDYVLPDFRFNGDGNNLRVSLWWAGMHAHRIDRRERGAGNRPEVLAWASLVRGECWRALDL